MTTALVLGGCSVALAAQWLLALTVRPRGTDPTPDAWQASSGQRGGC